MTKKQMKQAVKEMKEAGAEMMKERGGNFSFGEWAGESEREVIYDVTGFWAEDMSDKEIG